MNDEVTIISYGEKTISLRIKPFDTDINTEELLQVDMNNIIGDIITFPVIFNRIALMKADFEEHLATAKLDMEIFEAQVREEKRKALTFTESDSKGKEKVSRPTIPEIDAAVITDPRYRVKKKEVFRIERDLQYITSLYWSAKSKDTKLDRISEKVVPAEFEREIMDGEINGVMIKSKKHTY